MTLKKLRRFVVGVVVCLLPFSLATSTQADQVILDDLIVNGSACVGIDCVNGESFGFDTIRLKENNLRIKFQDTSNSASFPTNDWQLTANDSSNGGANKFSIDDIDGGRTPFTVEAGAPSHSLYVDDGGRIGFGTATPVVELHSVNGDSPTLRLEQNGSSGFTPQTWDVAGNEANFFVRDVTNGSKLPFKIKPNSPTSSIFVEGSTGDIGFQTESPEAPIHVRRTNGSARVLVEESGTTNQVRTMFTLRNATGGVQLRLEKNASNAETWRIRNNGPLQWFSDASGADPRMELDFNGNLTVEGDINSVGTTVVPDYVFEPEYKLSPLSEVAEYIAENKHLPNIPSATEIEEAGKVNVSEMQMKLLEKVEELTLYTIDQQKTIDELKARLEKVENSGDKVE